MADKVFELTVYEPLLYKSTDAYVFNCDSSITLVDENDSQEPTNVITGILLSVDVNKRIGTHNNIKVRLKIVQSTTNDEQKLNVTMLKNAFLGRKIRLDMIKDGKSYVIAENYYVFGAKPIKYNSDGVATYYVDLNIYSWDKLMDITKHSKSYVKKKLSGDILSGFMQSYKEKYAKLDLPECQTAGMRVMVCRPDDSSNGNENEEPAELAFPSLEQYDETDYNFLLRNANKCGEFFYFENGTLNLGLTRVMKETNGIKKEYVTRIDETSYASIESLSDENNEINETETLKAFGEKNANSQPMVPDAVSSNSNESGTVEPPKEDEDKDWNCVFAPQWSRVLAHFFQYTTIASFIVDTTEEEMSVRSYIDYQRKEFNDVVKDYQKTLQVGGGNSDNSNGDEAYCIYAPDSNLFKMIDKAKFYVSDNQYRITFDGGQMNLKLGDLVSCSGIGNGGRFVVVDVHSVYEKEDVADNPKIVNRMEVTVVPEISKDFAIPLPVDDCIKSCGSLRGSSNLYTGSKSNETSDTSLVSIRTATVHNSLDPYRMNQVLVKYEGETNPSAEWVKVLTPFASNDTGISCKLIEGDKVLVCTINRTTNEGTKKESFVVGSFYEGKDNTPPNGQRKFSTIIRSKNGQYIGFVDSKSTSDFVASFLPGFALVKNIIPQVGEWMSLSHQSDDDSDLLPALGGIEISDGLGFFTIAASSTNRTITISSPFGTVGIDAAMGITISAPNGNVKIVGKNIDIEAGNNLTLKSGTNIDSNLFSSLCSKSGSFVKFLKNELQSIADNITGLFDLPVLRFALELLFKPIAGTLKVHSGRYLLLEANGNDANLPDHRFSYGDKKEKTWSLPNHVEKLKLDQKYINNLAQKIQTWINNFKTYKTTIIEEYKNIIGNCQSLKDEIMNNFKKKNEDQSTESLNTSKSKEIIMKLLSHDTDNELEDDVKNLLVYDRNMVEETVAYSNIFNGVKALKSRHETFWKDDYKKTIFTKDNMGMDNEYESYVKNLRNYDPGGFEYLFAQYGNDSVVEEKLFKPSATQKCNLRNGVVYIINDNNNNKEFEYEFVEDELGNDERWIKMIDSIKLKTTKGTFGTGVINTGIDILYKMLPLEVLNTGSWGKDDNGQILMSQHVDSTLSINGQTLKEEFSGTSLAGVREAMRNATL